MYIGLPPPFKSSSSIVFSLTCFKQSSSTAIFSFFLVLVLLFLCLLQLTAPFLFLLPVHPDLESIFPIITVFVNCYIVRSNCVPGPASQEQIKGYVCFSASFNFFCLFDDSFLFSSNFAGCLGSIHSNFFKLANLHLSSAENFETTRCDTKLSLFFQVILEPSTAPSILLQPLLLPIDGIIGSSCNALSQISCMLRSLRIGKLHKIQLQVPNQHHYWCTMSKYFPVHLQQKNRLNILNV